MLPVSMVDEYGLIKVDAMASIHEKQNFIREKVVEILKKNKINIEG